VIAIMSSVGFPFAAPGEQRIRARPEGRVSLLVVDPADHAGDLAAALAGSCDVRVCTSAAEGLLLAGSLRPDVVLVASDVPDVPAATVVRLLDRCSDMPVIVATDGSHADEAAAALDAGAVACVARPYRTAQVLALVAAVGPARVLVEDTVLRSGALELSPVGGTVRLRGSLVLMPPRELGVLEHLMRNEGSVVSQAQLWAAVWGRSTPSASNTVSVHVRRLRQRLGDDPREPHIIRTVGRSGYLFQPVAG
jgi:DNA-binding response OmpR family regulator